MTTSAMRPMKDVLVLVGPSGSGKSTLIKLLQQAMPGRFAYSVSHTTRDPRPGEVNGQSYHFVGEAKFREMIAAGEFLEHATVHRTTLYGTSFAALRDVAEVQHKVALMDLDINGALSIRSHDPDAARAATAAALRAAAAAAATTAAAAAAAETGGGGSASAPPLPIRSCVVFIRVPTLDELERRLRGRQSGESEEKIAVRLESARKEMAWFEAHRDFFDIELVNGSDVNACFAHFHREVARIVFGTAVAAGDAGAAVAVAPSADSAAASVVVPELSRPTVPAAIAADAAAMPPSPPQDAAKPRAPMEDGGAGAAAAAVKSAPSRRERESS